MPPLSALKARNIPVLMQHETPNCFLAMIHDTEGNIVTLHKRKVVVARARSRDFAGRANKFERGDFPIAPYIRFREGLGLGGGEKF